MLYEDKLHEILKRLAEGIVSDGVEDVLNVLSVNSAGNARVQELGGTEGSTVLLSDEFESLFVVGTVSIVGEEGIEGRFEDLLAEKIVLVQEENNGSISEPLTRGNLTEELDRLEHAVSVLIFLQLHIILVQGRKIDDSRNAFEAMKPLSALGTLTTDVHNRKFGTRLFKLSFNDTRSTHTSAKNVVCSRLEVFLRESLNV